MKKVAIIGAGLGGLTAGALLAKDGYKVIILEQHNIVGGCATTFKRKGGFTCEVGLHEMDSLHSDETKNKIFEKLDIYRNVNFVKANELYRVKRGKLDFIVPDGIDKAKEQLSSLYPDEKEAIKRYFLLLERVSNEFNGLTNLKWSDYLLFPFKFRTVLRYKNRSAKEVFDSLFKSDELKLILNANIGYYSDNWAEFSFLMHAVAQYSYFNGGGWFIQGGSQNLSNYLKSVIMNNGGEVITKALVTKVDKNSLIYTKNKEDFSFAIHRGLTLICKPRLRKTSITLSRCKVGLPFSSSDKNRVPTWHNSASSVWVKPSCLRFTLTSLPISCADRTILPFGIILFILDSNHYFITDR